MFSRHFESRTATSDFDLMWRLLGTTVDRVAVKRVIIQPGSPILLPGARNYKDSIRTLTCTASSRSHDSTIHNDLNLNLSTSQRPTIYALSTPPGKAGIGVVRVSGPHSLDVWKRMVRLKSLPLHPTAPEYSKMYRCRVVNPHTSEILDDGLAVFFKGPRSFTTEDVLELHIHSGRAIIASILSSLSLIPSCRPAEPGEFTRRAFEGGRLDLTQVEGLKDLIDAETDVQRKIALRSADGASRVRFEELRTSVIRCLAFVEALIDFGEGEDIEEGTFDNAREMASKLHETIQRYLDSSRHGEIVRSGIRLAIFGSPNAGKSSLLNFLAQRDAAIVTPVPGTTRDILELSLDIGGLPVIVADTAGLRKTDDVVESIGVERAKVAIQAADVSLCVLSLPDVLVQTPQGPTISIPDFLSGFVTPATFFLLNKVDLVPTGLSTMGLMRERSAWTVSLLNGEGTTEFLAGFADALRERYNVQMDEAYLSEPPIVTHARQRVHLEQALAFLEEFLSTGPDDVALGAEALRYAADAIGKVTGAIGAEDVLDSLFQNFCIGK